jgi:PqqD family protein of HPr-rel-A system
VADRFRAAPAATLRIVPLDALTLIFHRASGITHVAEPPVPEILQALAGGPLDGAALLTALAAEYALAEEGAAALDARLEELVAAGLVERLA